jgi:hypothetical protein
MARIVLLQMATALVVALLAGIFGNTSWLFLLLLVECVAHYQMRFLRYACSWAPKNLVERTR